MPYIKVKTKEEDFLIKYEPGSSLRAILNQTDYQVRSGCRGNGTCGLCKVQIDSGKIDDSTVNELLYLGEDSINNGIRLACQVRPYADLEIRIINPLVKCGWKSLPARKIIRKNLEISNFDYGVKNPIGVAVDIGTTNISLSFFNLWSGAWIAGCYGLNPQLNFGSDIMTRLSNAVESKEKANKIIHSVRKAIGEALLKTAAGEGIDILKIVKIVFVGNTAMLSLLSGKNYDLLVKPSSWMKYIECRPDDTSALINLWNICPNASIEIVPPLAGFVGSDLLAGLLAVGNYENKYLFVDFGTNSEIALWNGHKLWTTSASGGPAFEGTGISCGMPAEPGAIFHVDLKQIEKPHLSVFPGRKACGICGSGMIDLIADLVKIGVLNKSGSFVSGIDKKGFLIKVEDKNIYLTKRDIDIFQRAKSAVCSGIQLLMKEAHIRIDELDFLFIAGAFGYLLNIDKAQSIGLLPTMDIDKVNLCGNTALSGSELLLLSSSIHEELSDLRSKAEYINLSEKTDFEEYFFNNLFLSRV